MLKWTKQVYHNVIPTKDAISEDFDQTASLTTNSFKLKWLTLAKLLRKSLKECLLYCSLFLGYSFYCLKTLNNAFRSFTVLMTSGSHGGSNDGRRPTIVQGLLQSTLHWGSF